MFYHLKTVVVEQVTRDIILHYVEIKDFNVMIDGRDFFDQPVKNNLVTYGNIQRIVTGKGDDYTTSCLLDYPNFKNYYKMIAIDLRKQQALESDPKAIQQVSFTENLDGEVNTKMFLLLKKWKKLF